ncbi:MAG: hypothetical protein KDC83_01645 [Flavobacteriales bacterium]|nr:hypothetical protein [Flavobacteriales bacterium]
MKKQLLSYVILFTILVSTGLALVTSNHFFPEIEEGKLNVTGRIKTERKKAIEKVRITILDSAYKQIGPEIFTDQKGRFQFTLAYDQKVRVRYQAEGFVTMFNTFDTKVPRQKKYKELYYDASIVLLSDSSSYNRRAISTKPFMKVAFNEGFDMFIEDVEESIAFVDELIQPNVGSVFMNGAINDTLQDTVNVTLVAVDSLGFVVAEAVTTPDGRYQLEVPLMSNVKVQFKSKDHYNAFAIVNTAVDSSKNLDDFNVKQDFNLVNKRVPNVNPAAFNKPIATISNDPSSGEFKASTASADVFSESLWALKNRMVLRGALVNRDSLPFKGTMIQVLDGDLISDEYEIDTPYFEIPLPKDAITHVKFKSKGFHTSFISINTNISKEDQAKLKYFKKNIELYSKDRTDINSDAFKLPMTKFYFDSESKSFVSDFAITEEFTAKLHEGVQVDTNYGKGEITLDCQVIDAITAKNVGKSKVRVMDENKKVVSSLKTDDKGKLTLRLTTNKVYFIELEADGYMNTLNEFNTEVPENYVDEDHITNPFFRILHQNTLFQEKTVPTALSDSMPITLFFFDEDKDHFDEDFSYMTNFERAVVNYVPPPPQKTGKELAEEEAAKKEALMAEARAAVEAAKVASEALIAAALLKEQGEKLKITGKILDENEQPVSGMKVELLEDKSKVESTESGADGAFAILAPYGKDMQLKFDDKSYHAMFMNVSTKLPEGKEPSPDKFDLKTVKAYNKKSATVNPRAFSLPVASIGYGATGATKKEWVSKQFVEALVVTPEVQRLAIDGRVREGSKNRSIGDAKILVSKKGKVIDTIIVDSRGKFETQLEFQEDYRFTVMKDGYYETVTAISTKTANSTDPLLDKRIKNMKLLLVNKADPDLNMSVFQRPFSRYAYNSTSGEFEEVDGISESFLADLYIDRNPKDDVQLTTENVSATTKVGKKGINDGTTKLGDADAANKRKANQNQQKQTELMANLNQTLAGLPNTNRARIKDVNLELERIINTGYELRGRVETEVDESLLDAIQQMEDLNRIIALAMGFKADAVLVPVDSTFIVNIAPRRYHYQNRHNVQKLYRDRIMYRDKVVDLVKLTDWWIYNTYYKNGKKINSETYHNEMARIRSTTYLVDSVGSI